MGVGVRVGCSSETCTISVAVIAGAHSAAGEGERLLGAAMLFGVEVRAGAVEVVLEVEVEAGAEARTGAGSSTGAGGSVAVALAAAGLL